MPDISQVIERFKQACRGAIARDEMDRPDPYRPPTPEEIAAAAEALDITFPADYLEFHLGCNGYHLPFWEVFSLSGSMSAPDHIVQVNLDERKDKQLSEELIAFHDDGTGNLLCFDTLDVDEQGNCSIVFWDHEDPPGDDKPLEEWATSFAEWLDEQIDEAELLEGN